MLDSLFSHFFRLKYLVYLILVILLIMGVIQTGAGDGLYYLFVPDWEKILNFTVWRAAAGQVREFKDVFYTF